MSAIKSVFAREILDSRGNPTVETTVYYEDGYAIASVPSGASTGKNEAVELRDQDSRRFNGLGVKNAVGNVNRVLGPAVIGMDVANQELIDNRMIEIDATPNKAKLGANSILSISLAVSKAASFVQKKPLYLWYNHLFEQAGYKTAINIPTPIFNVINGGKHGTGNLDFQEFHIIPASNKQYPEGLRIGTEIYHQISKVLKYRNAINAVGDEGGFAPNLYTNLDALEVIAEAIKQAGYTLQLDVFLGLDIAPAYFSQNGQYRIKDAQESFNSNQFIAYIKKLHETYHLLCLEDPLEEDSWNDWTNLTKLIGNEVNIIGDDLLVTNKERLKKAIDLKACNSILIKPNQIGTISETLKVIKMAKENNFKVVVSHRSGETSDSLIADFAIGVGADYVKFGAPARGERVVKYNRLLTIAYETSGFLL